MNRRRFNHPHSPFDDDDGHMGYLFLEKRHSEQSKKETETIGYIVLCLKCGILCRCTKK